MKKIISRFSDKLLSNQQLKAVKGGDYYCKCTYGGAPIATQTEDDCEVHCGTVYGWGYQAWEFKANQEGNGY